MLGMARLLFNLRHVEADEFDEVTTALDAAGIAWYQTRAGLLGLSAPGIWLRDDSCFEQARAVIEASQQQRAQRLQAEHAQAALQGEGDTFTNRLRQSPLEVAGGLLLMVLIIALVLGLPWLLWR